MAAEQCDKFPKSAKAVCEATLKFFDINLLQTKGNLIIDWVIRHSDAGKTRCKVASNLLFIQF